MMICGVGEILDANGTVKMVEIITECFVRVGSFLFKTEDVDEDENVENKSNISSTSRTSSTLNTFSFLVTACPPCGPSN
jgi:hypothetical protein